MTGLLLCGTLLDSALRRIVAGADLPMTPALFPGQGTWRASSGDWPVLAPGAGATGGLVHPDAAQLDRLDYYAAGFGFRRDTATALVDGAEVIASAYCPTNATPTDTPWVLDDWQRDWGPLTRTAATEAMMLYGTLSPRQLARSMPTMRMRADARLRGQNDPAPNIRRAGFTDADVTVVAESQPYTDFFAVRETTLRHPHFDGGESNDLLRAAYLCGDAVTVLPYDPVRDRVLLVEQFRLGPFCRGDRHPWSLEPVAGRIDPGETPETTAHRETREEAGLTLTRLIPVANYYPSPGAVTEYLYTYVGLADLPDSAAGLGGLEAEGEDIRAHVLPFTELEALVTKGEVDNGPLLTTTLWLAPRRTTLA